MAQQQRLEAQNRDVVFGGQRDRTLGALRIALGWSKSSRANRSAGALRFL
jgi:hypothetical protein